MASNRKLGENNEPETIEKQNWEILRVVPDPILHTTLVKVVHIWLESVYCLESTHIAVSRKFWSRKTKWEHVLDFREVADVRSWNIK